MAVYPCDWTGHRYPGPQRSMYVTTAGGASVESHKLRLCPVHFAEALDIARTFAAELTGDSQMSVLCEKCGADRMWSVFVKVFDEHAEPIEYVADFCAACQLDVVNALKVQHGRAMGAA